MRDAPFRGTVKYPQSQLYNIASRCKIKQPLDLQFSSDLRPKFMHSLTQQRHKVFEDGHMSGLTPDKLNGTLGLLRPRKDLKNPHERSYAER
jgi:hypothetical protein